MHKTDCGLQSIDQYYNHYTYHTAVSAADHCWYTASVMSLVSSAAAGITRRNFSTKHTRKRDLKYKCSMQSVNGLLCKIFTLSEEKKYFLKLRLWYLDLTNESNYNFHCIQMNIVYVQIILNSQHCCIPSKYMLCVAMQLKMTQLDKVKILHLFLTSCQKNL